MPSGVEVVNRQRSRKIDAVRWKEFSDHVLAVLGRSNCRAVIAFVSDQRMRDLNRRFRGKNKPTDVLSFPPIINTDDPGETDLGEIAIAVEVAERQALENGLKWDQEIQELILHGILHLCGYDHETDNGQMNRLELRLRRKLIDPERSSTE